MSDSRKPRPTADAALIARVRAAARQEQFLEVVSAEEARAGDDHGDAGGGYSPPPCGEALGVGVVAVERALDDPVPVPPPQRGGNAGTEARCCISGPMRIIGLAGWSGSGKTTLITKLIPRLTARGLRVSTLKHAHHGFDMDQPGKDSFVHRVAGATEVIISSAKRWAMLHELRDETEWDLGDLVGKMSPVDLVLVEGFKRDAFPKLEIHRAANGKPLLHPEDPHIVAVACDGPLPDSKVPVVDLNDIDAIADLLMKHAVAIGEVARSPKS
jgi:molybdopterin-guanine dinucleotide biosynthesis protein B